MQPPVGFRKRTAELKTQIDLMFYRFKRTTPESPTRPKGPAQRLKFVGTKMREMSMIGVYKQQPPSSIDARCDGPIH